MIIRQAVKDFEALGFGMFVHFGAYSVLGKGEWAKKILEIPYSEYDRYVQQFCPQEDWAERLAATAKEAGCKYITLTTRHHDGFSLFDTCGLNEYDTVHTCGRDLVREFVDACRKNGLIPFFYHTLLDWHDPRYETDFPAYLQYLRDSVALLCKNYGQIGGLWFDGMWNKWDADWEEDALYGTIRKYQPECIIINNTGLSKEGQLGHIELDSVTFERGKPRPLNMEGAPKYVASEMCEVFARHWGYAAEDLDFKSPADLIRTLADCRRYGANMLMNVGPMADGYLRPMDTAILGVMGQWVSCFDEAIRAPRPTGIAIEGKPMDFVLRDGNTYYLFCNTLSVTGDPNVALMDDTVRYQDTFALPEKVRSITWMDNGEALEFQQEGGCVTIHTTPFTYGRALVVRVAKILCD